ncbi:MAG: arginase [Candidatus Levybacteria bacterium]|nr:arginase [Candidatus Levybacteria bacterium]
MQKASLLGVPIDLGAETLGVDMGPQALRYGGIVEKLEHVGIRITDLGNIICKPRDEVAPGSPKLKHLSEIVRVANETAVVVEKEIKKGQKIIALGGDHTLTLGTVAGASKALKGDLGLIYIDAHGDFNTDKTTISGNIHGMSLSACVGLGAKELVNIYTKGVKVKKQNMILVGTTDLDKEEELLIKHEKVQTFDMLDILARSFGDLFGMILALSKRVDNVWVSFDLDCVDGLYAPGVGIPNTGGLMHREIMAIAKYIGKKCNVVGVDVVEYNPTRDIEHKTADLAIEVAARFLGHDYNAYTQYMDTQR